MAVPNSMIPATMKSKTDHLTAVENCMAMKGRSNNPAAARISRTNLLCSESIEIN